MDDRSGGSLMEIDHARRQKQEIISKPLPCMSFLLCRTTTANWYDIGQVTIDILPDDVLLVIFDYYLAEQYFKGWEMLVHVCQNWRSVVFHSPLRLNLRILCTGKTPVREKLAIWPPLPIIIKEVAYSTTKCGEDNIIATLGRYKDRICEIDLDIPSSLLERVFTAMQKTFMALKCLKLLALDDIDDMAPVLPDLFLGGSAPHLRRLSLVSISFPFPVLQKLLLSAPNLVLLSLYDIPLSAFFSPEEIVTCVSTLTRLKRLGIKLVCYRSCPSGKGWHPPPTRSVLRALTHLTFIGVKEYLEDLLTRIDAPLLDSLNITFYHYLIFDTPQLVQFISRTPKLNAYDEARVTFSHSHADIALWRVNLGLELQVLYRRSHDQLLSLAQVCTSSLPQDLIRMVKHLYILDAVFRGPLWQGDSDLENSQWLELFHPFTAVKNLYLSREFVPRIVPILQEIIEERVTEVLPNLESIFLEDLDEPGLVPEAMRQSIAERQLSGRPIATSYWTRYKWPTR